MDFSFQYRDGAPVRPDHLYLMFIRTEKNVITSTIMKSFLRDHSMMPDTHVCKRLIMNVENLMRSHPKLWEIPCYVSAEICTTFMEIESKQSLDALRILFLRQETKIEFCLVILFSTFFSRKTKKLQTAYLLGLFSQRESKIRPERVAS